MKDVNYPLRKAYFALLSGIIYNTIPIPVYYQKAPDDILGNYIVYGGITNSDASSKFAADTDTTIRVTIHTYAEKYNDGAAADFIAGFIFDAVYATNQSVLDLNSDGLQNVTTRLASDFTQNYNLQNIREYVDRVLTFSHRIFHYTET